MAHLGAFKADEKGHQRAWWRSAPAQVALGSGVQGLGCRVYGLGSGG